MIIETSKIRKVLWPIEISCKLLCYWNQLPISTKNQLIKIQAADWSTSK